MIKVELIDVYGFESAIRGMRNPKNSWHLIDSNNDNDQMCNECENCLNDHYECKFVVCPEFKIGKNDLKLMRNLYKGGTEHRKYLRYIDVTMDVTAPLYWWKEFDTFKIGTVANSCSTMHKIHSKPITVDDFSCEHLYLGNQEWLEDTIELLNHYREAFNKSNDKNDWWQMIQMLPSSYNQKRTIKFNYEVVMNIIRQRRTHKLDEWRNFVNILLELPYVRAIMQDE